MHVADFQTQLETLLTRVSQGFSTSLLATIEG
jgi:hypothetical protein